jgi:hypothetical protein
MMANKLKELSNRLKVKIKLAQVKAARALAETIPEVIRIRTQQEGDGVNGPLKSLEPSTKKYRKRYEANLSSDTDPDRSNLTATGQLLDSIKGKNIGSKVVIEPGKSKRKGELSGGKSRLTNREVNKYVDENGREFLRLNKQETEEATNLAKDIIAEELRSVIK